MELFIHDLLRVGGFFFLIFAASSQPLVPQCYEGNSDEDTEMNIHGNCKHRKLQMRNPMILFLASFLFRWSHDYIKMLGGQKSQTMQEVQASLRLSMADF